MPPEVEALEEAFSAVPGIHSVDISNHHYDKNNLEEAEALYFAGPFADLPIAMLKRTGGNLEKELLIAVEFRIEPNEKGLKGLEFLSWWVRDASRSGKNWQIRTIGLPPVIGEETQLGETLRFWFEAYVVTEEEDMGQVLEKVGLLAESLKDQLQPDLLALF